MRTAEAAARSAMDAYRSAMSKVAYYIKQMGVHESALITYNNLLKSLPSSLGFWQAHEPPEEWKRALANFNNEVAWVKHFETKAKDAKVAAVATHSFAVLAVSKADDAINNVFALTRDLQNLGILLDLARRTDAIAGATRTKLAEFEKRLADDPSKVIIPVWTIPALPPEPTVVAPPALAPPTAIGMAYEEARAEADRTGRLATWTPALGWHVIDKAGVQFPVGF